MAQNSKIEWTHHTLNLWHGCTKVHAGCDNCYAETLSHRWGRDIWGPDKPRMIVKHSWIDLRRFQMLAENAGQTHRVFVGSMMDIFEKPMPLLGHDAPTHLVTDTGQLRNMFFGQIQEGKYPNLQFLFLTKRPSNINKYIPEEWKDNPPANVMFGTSISDQKTADDLIPQLLEVKGRRFLSIEPLLGPIDVQKSYGYAKAVNVGYRLFGRKCSSCSGNGYYNDNFKSPCPDCNCTGINDDPYIDWVIVGGESGHGARPMHPDWVRSLRDQCKAANVPFFFKQWGEFAPHMADVSTNRVSVSFAGIGYEMCKVGKKASGRELDGHIYSEFPVTSI